MIEKAVLEELYLEKRLSSITIGEKVGVSDRTIRKWLKKYAIPRRTISEVMTKYPKTDFNGDLCLKAYILGLRTGDIHAKRIHKVIRVQTTTTHIAQLFMIERTFGIFSHVGTYLFFNKKFNSNEWFVYCDLNESFSFMLEKPARMPDWMFENDSYFYNFLAGYSDSEGSWKMLKSHANSVRLIFQIASQDKEVLDQLVTGLKKMGFTPHIYLTDRAGITKYGAKNNKDMYRIMVYRTPDVIKLAKIILPLSRHQEKIDRIKLILNSQGKTWNEICGDLLALREKIKGARLQINPKL